MVRRNNINQQVKGDHPNYNNYGRTLDHGHVTVTYSATNRTGSGQAEEFGEMGNGVTDDTNCIGNVPNYNGGGVDVYGTFNIGALEEVEKW